MRELILASASPRRKELLSQFGIPFVVDPSMADEGHVTGTCKERVLELAKMKCAEVVRRHQDDYVLAADTLVCVDEHILGKPHNEEEAEQMLALLSGRIHEVHTGVCLYCPNGEMICGVDTTKVSFIPLDRSTIKHYAATKEPLDKAGAYAIQGMAGIFVDRIEGSFSNVIGLPLALVYSFLQKAGIKVFADPTTDRA